MSEPGTWRGGSPFTFLLRVAAKAFPHIERTLDLLGIPSTRKDRPTWIEAKDPGAGKLRIYDVDTSINRNPPHLHSETTLDSALDDTIKALPPVQNDDLRIYIATIFNESHSQIGPLLQQVGFDPTNFEFPKHGFLNSLSDHHNSLRPAWDTLETFDFVDTGDEAQVLNLRDPADVSKSLVRAVVSIASLKKAGKELLVIVLFKSFRHCSIKRTRLEDHIPSSDTKNRFVNFEAQADLSKAKFDEPPASEAPLYMLPDLQLNHGGFHSITPAVYDTSQLLILMLQHFYLKQYSRFLMKVLNGYARHRDRSMDPGYLLPQHSSMKEVMADAYYYQSFNDKAVDLSEALEGLVSRIEASPVKNASAAFAPLATDIRALASRTRTIATRLLHRIDHHLKFLELSRNVRESQDLRLLSQLASIFLPLSLAAGLLSMQNRVFEVGLKLYDFCGVAAILAAITVLIIGCLRLYQVASERQARFEKGTAVERYIYDHRLWPTPGYFRFMRLMFLVVFVGSFLLGMFVDLYSGIQLLIGTACILVGAFTVLPIMIYLVIFLCTLPQRRSHGSGASNSP